MRFRCMTAHGLTNVLVKLDQSNGRVLIDWGSPGPIEQLEYIFDAKPVGAVDFIAEAVLAELALSHFDRTHTPLAGVLHVGTKVIEPSGQLVVERIE